MKNHVHTNKYEPIVLTEENPDYTHVKLAAERETTVSLRHLAPKGDKISDKLDKSL